MAIGLLENRVYNGKFYDSVDNVRIVSGRWEMLSNDIETRFVYNLTIGP